MEYTMKMPAGYNVLSYDEMTYTEGGSLTTMTEAVLNWIPFVGWYQGVMAVRSYRKANPNTWLDTGLDAIIKDMNQGTANTIRDLGRMVWTVASCATGVGLIVNAALILI